MNRIVLRTNKILLPINQVYLKILDFSAQVANKIKIGKQTRIYLGMLENVPVSVGKKNANTEKTTYETRTFFVEYKIAIKPIIPTTSS